MSSEKTQTAIRVYYVPQSFPCGPKSSCCGPTGQSEEDLNRYKASLEKEMPGTRVQFVDASRKLDSSRDAAAAKLLNSFGASACPMFAVGDEIVSMGPPTLPELVGLIKAKLSAPKA